MKKWMLTGCGCLLAVAAQAQFAGLPVADGAAAETGETRLAAGTVMSDDFNLYGGRALFAPFQGLALFADGGVIDPDGGDPGLALQGGAKLALPFSKSPVAVALRATWGYAGYDIRGGDVKGYGFSAGALVSRDVQLFVPYAFLGLNFTDTTVKTGGTKDDDRETDLAAAAGLRLRLGDRFSLYAEVAHVDEVLFGLGAGWTF